MTAATTTTATAATTRHAGAGVRVGADAGAGLFAAFYFGWFCHNISFPLTV
jgi:hypothetical protein